jgi:hypothetical protein
MNEKADAVYSAITDYVYWACQEVEESIRRPNLDTYGRRKEDAASHLRQTLQDAFGEES